MQLKMKTQMENNEKGDFLELYKSSKGFEKPLILICLASTCVVPFALLALNFELMIGSWVLGLVTIFAYKFLRKRRTKEKIKVDILPRIKI